MRVLAQNWRCPYGEIDVVAEDGDEVVFVEVKTRRGTAYGLPEEAITPRKQRHMIAAALSYMAALPPPERPFRIDVVAVQLAPSGTVLAVRHYPGAVTSEE
jgi:putative endonuclease